MNQKELKTSWKQRVVIGIIAFLMLFSTVAVYALIVLSNEAKDRKKQDVSKEMKEIEAELKTKSDELEVLINQMSDKYYGTLAKYRSRVKSYNAASVNNGGLKTNDLVKGKGEEIKEDSSYYSYYIGWCADESIFDSSFDNNNDGKKLMDPIGYVAGQSSFVAGWEEGVIGMKVGGVREISIPGALAYGESREICGGKNSPLKFVIMVVDPGEDYKKKIEEYNKLNEQYQILYYSQQQDLIQ